MKFTIVINDISSPASGPLIYTIDMPRARATAYGNDDRWDDLARSRIAEARLEEIGDDNEIAAGDIELLFAFAGDISPVADWRE